MAIDKGVDSEALDGLFTDIANAIRGKNGETAQYTPSEMPAAIAGLSTGMTVTRGTVNGTGARQYVNTGLNTVTYFFIFPADERPGTNKSGSLGFLYDGVANVRWRIYNADNLTKATKYHISFSGGTAILGDPSVSNTLLISGTVYTWIAIGS